jgi:hypothetical protein
MANGGGEADGWMSKVVKQAAQCWWLRCVEGT